MTESKPKIHSQALGRRKQAVASVRLISGTGKIIVNGKPADAYFGFNEAGLVKLRLPFASSGITKYDAIVSAHGGGLTGQLDSAALGIARCLVELKEEHRVTMRKNGLLTRDPRKRQRRMVGMGGKSRRRKQSPKR